jgi:hypothetical protein
VAALTVYEIGLTDEAKAYVTPANGDTFANPDGRVILHFKCSGTQKTVTINSVRPCDQGTDHDITITVPATTGDEMRSGFSPTRFNDAAGNVTISTITPDTTGLTVVAVRSVG